MNPIPAGSRVIVHNPPYLVHVPGVVIDYWCGVYAVQVEGGRAYARPECVRLCDPAADAE